MKYRSLGEYKRCVREAYLQKHSRPIESDVQAFLAFSSSLVTLALGLKQANETGREEVWHDVLTGRPAIICHPGGEVEFLEKGDPRVTEYVPNKQQQEIARMIEELQEACPEMVERLDTINLPPIGMDDVLDIVSFLRKYEGDLSELEPWVGPLIERGEK